MIQCDSQEVDGDDDVCSSNKIERSNIKTYLETARADTWKIKQMLFLVSNNLPSIFTIIQKKKCFALLTALTIETAGKPTTVFIDYCFLEPPSLKTGLQIVFAYSH